MAITGIPPYSHATPIECSVRCACGRRYLIFNPGAQSIGDAEGRARERAAEMHCSFINSARAPFKLCACGACLDFSPGESYEMVM
ncbi:MAG: hypothetical protein V7641_2064 [Blastocatellia bacterium]